MSDGRDRSNPPKEEFDGVIDAFKKGLKGKSRRVKITEEVKELADEAKNETVTPERLVGNEEYFNNIFSFLERNEQPHYLFPLTKGLTAKSPLVVESGAEREVLINKFDGGSLAVTNRYVRIHSKGGEWTIPYSSISSVDFIGYPELHVQTSGRTYYIRIAGTHFDEKENLSEATDFIREKQRYEDSEETEVNELDKLEKLGRLRDEGVLTEEEFNQKKRDLLEDI